MSVVGLPHLVSQHAMQPYYGSFECLSGSYGSKVTPVGLLNAGKTVETVFLYAFRIAFTASLLGYPKCKIINSHGLWKYLPNTDNPKLEELGS